MSNKSIASVLPERQDRVRSEDNDDSNDRPQYGDIGDHGQSNTKDTRHPAGAMENGEYENESGEGYGYSERGEGEYEVYGDMKKRFKSVLEEDAYTENVLTAAEASKCLNRIDQVGRGMIYAYIQIDVDHRNLTDIEEIVNFRYLSLINVSHNHLSLNALDVLRDLEYVVVVHADHNAVAGSLCLSPMAYLQVLTLNSNRVSSLSGLKQPSLECLELNDNKISRLLREPNKNFDTDGRGDEIDCPNLSTLALSRNALETVEQFAFVSVKLRVLYLSYNKIDRLKGLEHLPNLSRLHLRANRISSLDGFAENLIHLSYLNLRENRLRDLAELDKLARLKSLRTLVVSHNDFGEKPRTVGSKVLKVLPWLDRIDKEAADAFADGQSDGGGGESTARDYGEGPYDEE